MEEEATEQQTLLSKVQRSVAARCPEQTVRYGVQLLSLDYEGTWKQESLGDQRWSLIERVLLDCGPYNLRSWMLYCFAQLHNKFPKSNRVKRLAAYLRESNGNYEEAISIYTSLVTENPEDVVTRKRIMACLKNLGRNAEVVEYMNKHLMEFGLDQSTWLHLAEIYETEGYLSQALFCYQELILQNPRNPCYPILCAELLASIGDYPLAMDYYSMALALQPNSMRGLWGILRTSSMYKVVKDSKKCKDVDKREVVIRLAALRLQHLYETLETEERNQWTELCLDIIREDYLEGCITTI